MKPKTPKRKIYASKEWLIERAGQEAARSYKVGTMIDLAMRSAVDAFCEMALSNGYSSGNFPSKTSDGMEWNVKFEQIGKRNPKTGKIDKRLRKK